MYQLIGLEYYPPVTELKYKTFQTLNWVRLVFSNDWKGDGEEEHSFVKKSEPAGARTQDPVIKSHMLYQLSYRPVKTEERVR